MDTVFTISIGTPYHDDDGMVFFIPLYIIYFIKFHRFVHNILSRKEILTTTKGHTSIVNLEKLTHKNPNLDLVTVNAYEKFPLIPPIHSKDIEQKQNSDNNQVSYLCC